jgi:hypothetical protein
VLRDAGFDRQVLRSMTVRHAWTVETIVGFLQSLRCRSVTRLAIMHDGRPYLRVGRYCPIVTRESGATLDFRSKK